MFLWKDTYPSLAWQWVFPFFSELLGFTCHTATCLVYQSNNNKKMILSIHLPVHPKQNCGDVINGLVNESFTLGKKSSSRLWEKNTQSKRSGSRVRASLSYCSELDAKFQNSDINMFLKVHKLASNKLKSFHYTEKGWIGDWEGGAEKNKAVCPPKLLQTHHTVLIRCTNGLNFSHKFKYSRNTVFL